MAKVKSVVEYRDGELTMRQRIDDGYINLNDIAKSTGKRLDKWLANKSTQELLFEFENQQLNTPNSGYLNKAILTQKGRDGSTWAHPDIAIQCAQWCSPAFALWCSRIIRNYMINGAGNPLWQENRKALKESNSKLRDTIKAYVDRHEDELSANRKKWIFNNVNDKLSIAIAGVNVSKFKRMNHSDSFRDALSKDQLRNLELLESVVIRLIELKDMCPLEAVESAKERLLLMAA